MPGLGPGIHDFAVAKTWMAGTTGSPLRERSGVPRPGHDDESPKRGLLSSISHCLLMPMGGWVYFMTNRRNGTLYTGVTNDLPRRAYQHREG